jgi:hypothetical protein
MRNRRRAACDRFDINSVTNAYHPPDFGDKAAERQQTARNEATCPEVRPAKSRYTALTRTRKQGIRT